MDDVKAFTSAFLLIAISLPLVSYGSTNGAESLTSIGFVALLAACTIPIVLRYVDQSPASS
ncbi:hypothetical protein [Natronolimnohabitans innermongolicus]|uniref:Uncharacterized protein n=1 Tax=Natronolimnohabitans innermongolicus JCM 12255 TaxID=1227499 RepID=L9WPB6_9EURY|nr:hypothetical protein [Natronolimnohabitans innermongolicus]ELY50188.1 hypothetical protein C493_19516 [Natronolimnohabitans innermongolicus JCM 12255]